MVGWSPPPEAPLAPGPRVSGGLACPVVCAVF